MVRTEAIIITTLGDFRSKSQEKKKGEKTTNRKTALLALPTLRKVHERWNEGSSDGAVVRALALHRCDSGSIPPLDVICRLSLLLVLFSAPRGFSPGTPVFPSHQKSTFPNSNSIQISVDE